MLIIHQNKAAVNKLLQFSYVKLLNSIKYFVVQNERKLVGAFPRQITVAACGGQDTISLIRL